MSPEVELTCKLCGQRIVAVLDPANEYTLKSVRRTCDCFMEDCVVEDEAQRSFMEAYESERSRPGRLYENYGYLSEGSQYGGYAPLRIGVAHMIADATYAILQWFRGPEAPFRGRVQSASLDPYVGAYFLRMDSGHCIWVDSSYEIFLNRLFGSIERMVGARLLYEVDEEQCLLWLAPVRIWRKTPEEMVSDTYFALRCYFRSRKPRPTL